MTSNLRYLAQNSKWWINSQLMLKIKENFVLSVLLKRADWREVPPSIGRDSWGDLVSRNKSDWKFFLQRYLWSPKQIKLKFLSAEISMESLASLFLGPWSPNFWLTQASTQLVSIHIIREIWKSSFFSPSGRLRPHFLTVCRPNVTLTSTEVSSLVQTNWQTSQTRGRRKWR